MIPEILVHFKQTGASHADAGENASDFFLGFLRLMTGYKTVRVQDGNVISETDVKAWKVVGGIIATILCAPIAIPMTLIGLIPYIVSDSHSAAYSVYKNSRNPPDSPKLNEKATTEAEKVFEEFLYSNYPEVDPSELEIEQQLLDCVDGEGNEWKEFPGMYLYFSHWQDKSKKVHVRIFDLREIKDYWETTNVGGKEVNNDGKNPYTRDPFEDEDLSAIRAKLVKLGKSAKKAATMAKTSELEDLQHKAGVKVDQVALRKKLNDEIRNEVKKDSSSSDEKKAEKVSSSSDET